MFRKMGELCPHLLIYSVEFLLNAYNGPGRVLDPWNKGVNKRDKNSKIPVLRCREAGVKQEKKISKVCSMPDDGKD